ncbi:hypothetical protein [Pedobacter frigoris]|uniref:Uncharacterized protein n=1 Tax=Pedobacter frigoris TaxID=2571272 RepID=A0A4U1CJP4_9SPHI|nr:hypothetical protein [Pedobacter frigoris]TKC07189.1 hypothetical protein FA047_07990 [Pedobacter frigoris]
MKKNTLKITLAVLLATSFYFVGTPSNAANGTFANQNFSGGTSLPPLYTIPTANTCGLHTEPEEQYSEWDHDLMVDCYSCEYTVESTGCDDSRDNILNNGYGFEDITFKATQTWQASYEVWCKPSSDSTKYCAKVFVMGQREPGSCSDQYDGTWPCSTM